ncbi:GNAT family N-acetyltransferase [Devosia sp. FKR38]|uniref:GNAT family N-acetyltransferase n=1 Tax=Devosia sp. FKR38 TaxID=2562312 RepID=UPI0010C115D6|nr:GNAT family N-acetyltransferase [Devosia sp. FKR38]
MTSSIASITPADLDDIVVMAGELSLHEGDPVPDVSASDLAEVMFSSHPLLFGSIAHVDQMPAGYALWTVGYTMQYGKSLLEIVDLYVRPDVRRKGIGRALMRTMAHVAQGRGYRFLTVKTFNGNAEANAFYRACGGMLDQTNVYGFGLKAMAGLRSEACDDL